MIDDAGVAGGTMRAAVFTAPGRIELQEIERFTPVAGEVLVRTKASAICTTERRVFTGELKGIPFPIIGGHEFSGVVQAVEGGPTELRPGDHVVLDAVRRCGYCHYCLRGASNLCQNRRVQKGEFLILGGGFAEFVTLPFKHVHRLPKEISFAEAALTEPLACCLRSFKKGRVVFGDTILILGAGTMGALHAMLGKKAGARSIVSDLDDARLEFVKSIGTDTVVNPTRTDLPTFVKEMTDGRGADVVFVTASHEQAGQQALESVGRLGRVVLYASLHGGKLTADWNQIHYRETSIVGTEGKTEDDFSRAVALMASRGLPMPSLVSKCIPLDQLAEELTRHPVGSTQRVVVRF